MVQKLSGGNVMTSAEKTSIQKNLNEDDAKQLLDDYNAMISDPKAYKRYETFEEAVNEVLSDQS